MAITSDILNTDKVAALVALLNKGTKLTPNVVGRQLRISRPDYIKAYIAEANKVHAGATTSTDTPEEPSAPDTTPDTPAPKPAAKKAARKRAANAAAASTPAPAAQTTPVAIVLRDKAGKEIELEIIRQTSSTIMVQHPVPDVRRVILQGKTYNVDVKLLSRQDPAATYSTTTLTNEQVLAAAQVA